MVLALLALAQGAVAPDAVGAGTDTRHGEAVQGQVRRCIRIPMRRQCLPVELARVPVVPRVSPTPTATPQCDTRCVVRQVWADAGLDYLWPTVERIANCESGFDQHAYTIDTNGYASRGIFQINDQWWAWLWSTNGWQWDDAADNARAALVVYREGGFGQWSCY